MQRYLFGHGPRTRSNNGTVKVTAVTTGDGTDEDGYKVLLNEESKSLETNGSVDFEDIEKGTYNVELNGLDTRCTVDGDNPISVDVAVAETATANFGITCEESGKDSKIVFYSDRDGDEEIFLMNPDGSNVQQLTDNRSSDWHPSISNDGTQVAFVRNGRALIVMDIDGSNVRELTRSTDHLAYPSWSPDDAIILFGDDRSGYHEIYTIKPDGSDLMQLTNSDDFNDSNFNNYSPRLSPDGGTIAFQRGNSKTPHISHIFMMNADGTDMMQVTNTNDDNNTSNHNPAWSPDGSKIAFQTDRDENDEIYTMNHDGSDVLRITNNSKDDSSPVWSPDGTELLFETERDGNDEIYKIKADGSGMAKNLTNTPSSDDQNPDW